ncbi:TraR/DksA family transcriptional regulator [Oceanispirochaeta crateris]|uniref:TraR/DksA family transcriptional regulator n=1 Tax=Oceanispirochaeta crateris TaxID=2518645 RepID=A0A5C1QL45_9SPIO|nr:TraR/DksA family transcriptional regulator [Oceanispirochaeta crateris]QEN08885.1 TraR/DksA family transcriptional regulator [Oceanispirochaeta crateris]
MEKEFQDKMRTTLLEIKEQVLRNLISENEDFKAAVEDLGVKDLADIASNDIDVRTLEALSSQETLRLNKVESALIRLENGKYGVCARCTKKIAKDRLEAIPYAVLCIECKSDSEKRKN